MDILGGILIFGLLVALFGPERKTRQERDMLAAFPKDVWRVYPSFENEGKWGIFSRGIMYADYDTQKEAEAMKNRMEGRYTDV